MFMKMFKNIGEEETKTNTAMNAQDEEKIEKAMKEVLEIIDNQILAA